MTGFQCLFIQRPRNGELATGKEQKKKSAWKEEREEKGKSKNQPSKRGTWAQK